jgi:hypothetical protein
MHKLSREAAVRWIGRKFERLIVEEYLPGNARTHPKLRCLCRCGKRVVVSSTNLLRWRTKSCGCLNDETRVSANTTHGMSRSTEYQIWKSMIQRCGWSKHPYYNNYGGRGIKVCSRWLQFDNFFADMGLRPKKMTLERKDNSRGYEPDNCCWASRRQQNTNRRNNTYISFRGQVKTLTEWSEELDMPIGRISSRLRRYGYSAEEALTSPLYGRHREGANQ